MTIRQRDQAVHSGQNPELSHKEFLFGVPAAVCAVIGACIVLTDAKRFRRSAAFQVDGRVEALDIRFQRAQLAGHIY
jgi:hypothetical protein